MFTYSHKLGNFYPLPFIPFPYFCRMGWVVPTFAEGTSSEPQIELESSRPAESALKFIAGGAIAALCTVTLTSSSKAAAGFGAEKGRPMWKRRLRVARSRRWEENGERKRAIGSSAHSVSSFVRALRSTRCTTQKRQVVVAVHEHRRVFLPSTPLEVEVSKRCVTTLCFRKV